MITIANAFILLLIVGAAFVGVSSLVEKRTVKRDRVHERSSNSAS
jgi:hypothetical protein